MDCGLTWTGRLGTFRVARRSSLQCARTCPIVCAGRARSTQPTEVSSRASKVYGPIRAQRPESVVVFRAKGHGARLTSSSSPARSKMSRICYHQEPRTYKPRIHLTFCSELSPPPKNRPSSSSSPPSSSPVRQFADSNTTGNHEELTSFISLVVVFVILIRHRRSASRSAVRGYLDGGVLRLRVVRAVLLEHLCGSAGPLRWAPAVQIKRPRKITR